MQKQGLSLIHIQMCIRDRKKGVAVLFIGEDLDVLLQISDRIMVMCHGEAIGVVDAKSTTKEELGLMMAGKKKGDA